MTEAKEQKLAKPGPKRIGEGVYTLQDIKDRCVIDDVTGCWLWALNVQTVRGKGTPRCGAPPGLIVGQEKRTTYTTARLALILFGRVLSSDQVVWRKCLNDRCCNPSHLKAGTRIEEGEWRRKHGYLRGDPLRKIANRKSVYVQAIPPDVVRKIEAMLSDNIPRETIIQDSGACHATICKIAKGRHLHQRQRAIGYSVFSSL